MAATGPGAGARRSGPRRSSRRSCNSGLRGRGGAGFPTGIKWQTVAETAAAAEIHRLQRRRGRQRHLRRPHDHGRRSLRADRGHDDRRHRGRRDQGLRLYPLRISACHRGAGRSAIAVARARRHARRAASRARHTPSTSRCGSAPAPMSAARRPRCSKAWKASAAWCAPSRRCRRTRACSAGRR